ncbi:MAG: hypothetical protein H7Z72_08700 [Bacteroidetes bacterium]|nr:hypothetical protein [Fibrella sp.]
MNTLQPLAFSVTRPAYPNLFRWQEPLATRLRYRHDLPGRVANRLLNVELGLFLMSELLPLAPAEALPDLLNGQGAAYRERPVWTPRQHRSLSEARALLAPYQSRMVWLRALAKYATLPAGTRAFNVDGRPNTKLAGSELRQRLSLFQRALV